LGVELALSSYCCLIFMYWGTKSGWLISTFHTTCGHICVSPLSRFFSIAVIFIIILFMCSHMNGSPSLPRLLTQKSPSSLQSVPSSPGQLSYVSSQPAQQATRKAQTAGAKKKEVLALLLLLNVNYLHGTLSGPRAGHGGDQHSGLGCWPHPSIAGARRTHDVYGPPLASKLYKRRVAVMFCPFLPPVFEGKSEKKIAVWKLWIEKHVSSI
jgi:hypothetical protein